jgi:hypothetical protein
LLPLMFLPPPLLLLLPQDAAPNASAQTPATAKTERGFKTRIPLLNASWNFTDTAGDPILPTRAPQQPFRVGIARAGVTRREA